MARKADRVGVRKDQVDIYGRPIAIDFYKNLIQDLPSWTDMPVWVGGTEQLLPENDDEPVTTPIKADIQYPDELLNDQYFFYRKSPTEVDGLAKIRSIKGNTIVWNQYAKVLSETNWNAESGVTVSYSDGVATVSSTTRGYGIFSRYGFNPVVGHKYFITCDAKSPNEYGRVIVGGRSITGVQIDFSLVGKANTWVTSTSIKNCNAISSGGTFYIYSYDEGGYENISFRNFMVIDLTQMYGSTIADNFYQMEVSSPGSGVAFLKQYFMLPYYAYDSGRLLSFNGTGVKTTGKNLVAKNIKQTTNKGITFTPINETQVYIKGTSNATYAQPTISDTFTLLAGTYRFSIRKDGTITNDVQAVLRTSADVDLGNASLTQSRIITLAEDTLVKWTTYIAGNNAVEDGNLYVQIEYGNVQTDYVPYVAPYTSSLPISTFFPTGMKSAGTVYDELLPDKAITRIGAVDLGTLDWNMRTEYPVTRFDASISDMSKATSTPYSDGIANAKYEPSNSPITNVNVNNTIARYNGSIYICDSSYESAADFKSAMSGVYLYYELATPVVQSTLVFE